MLKFDLRAAMNEFEARTGLKMTYEILSNESGISIDTLKSMASRDYNATLQTISSVSIVLRCNPINFFHWKEDHF